MRCARCGDARTRPLVRASDKCVCDADHVTPDAFMFQTYTLTTDTEKKNRNVKRDILALAGSFFSLISSNFFSAPNTLGLMLNVEWYSRVSSSARFANEINAGDIEFVIWCRGITHVLCIRDLCFYSERRQSLADVSYANINAKICHTFASHLSVRREALFAVFASTFTTRIASNMGC